MTEETLNADFDGARFLLATVTDVPVPAVGSVEITADCGHLCWISPSTQVVIDRLTIPHETLCSNCMFDNDGLIESILDTGLSITPDQRESLREEIGLEDAEQLIKQLRITERDL